MNREKYIQIESKNALLELLKEGRRFQRIFLAQNAYKDPKTEEIIVEAAKQHVPVNKVTRRILDRRARTSSCESVIGLMEQQNQMKLNELLEDIYSKDDQPFLLVFDHIKYSLNIGAITRTAFGAFVNGIITPIKKANLINNETIRISMGACERIPFVEMNLFQAIKELQEKGIRCVALEVGGVPHYKADLTGPIAIILGAEDVGVSEKILERCDQIVSLPMREGIGSLNVNASAGIVMYEKIRQEAMRMEKLQQAEVLESE
jgi:23S rRNA (guanosine2251-2'-O)-methyltransferase